MSLAAVDEQLRDASERDDLTIDELVGSAEDLLGVLAPKQTRYRVRERPDVRTIRYYVTQRLLPKPVGYRGGRARYSGTHLLRLLTIKRLQARHLTLEAIRRRLEASTDAELLEDLLGPESPPATPASSRQTAPPPVAEPETVSLSVEEEPTEGAPEAVPCRRMNLGPGVELHVPDELLDDPARRKKLAKNLETLARRLRNPQSR